MGSIEANGKANEEGAKPAQPTRQPLDGSAHTPPTVTNEEATHSLAEIDRTRRVWASWCFGSGVLVGLFGLAYLVVETNNIVRAGAKKETIDFALGLAIAGKCIAVAVLLATAFGLIGVAERLGMPLDRFLDYTKLKSANSSVDVDEIVKKVVTRASAVLGLKDAD